MCQTSAVNLIQYIINMCQTPAVSGFSITAILMGLITLAAVPVAWIVSDVFVVGKCRVCGVDYKKEVMCLWRRLQKISGVFVA